ncbi:hypothetical protein N7462_007320 [Penicillium macrosclerotiorum]|uniref:uncharacterized protein n=1 Tax=Penicillium macrosclerotiorum TaxID=303699 RepID=UPI002547CFDE|nr:uncharacterized protein N7462_007320 [Penicillium macrosclerotiorum]KAJ5679076.1 hypothetical protein N7462_007320 [Penicillium macrosclerotiorum]
MTSDDNYTVFRECLSSAIVARSEKPRTTVKRRPKAKRNGHKEPSSAIETTLPERVDPEELAEFVDESVQFIASETFTSFPLPLQTISYSATQHDPALAALYVPADTDTPVDQPVLESLCATVPVTVTDSLSVYGLIPDAADLPSFLSPVLSEYITSVTTAPPVWSTTRADACEICERDWIPLSYHHLIPRGVHAKVMKKGWHDEWMLNSVAWLCRACHSFVHRMASNEELAREWFTVDRILEREDVQDWAKWVGRVRWKAK